tara:strand:- start:575 stop:982 length:408 start_codon:yes stop_codon:yes gene_type:complete
MQHLTIKAAAALALTAGAVLGAPVAANTAATAVFSELRLGSWEFRERGEDRARRICIRSERDLVQLRHRGQSCRRIVVDDNGTSATVQYSCTGSGYGRTYIRREGRDLVQLRTDGIERGAPFSIEAEGRRVGSCN